MINIIQTNYDMLDFKSYIKICKDISANLVLNIAKVCMARICNIRRSITRDHPDEFFVYP